MYSALTMHDKNASVIMRLDNTAADDGRRGMGDTIHRARPPHPLRLVDRQTPAPKIAAPACPSKPRLSRLPQIPYVQYLSESGGVARAGYRVFGQDLANVVFLGSLGMKKISIRGSV